MLDTTTSFMDLPKSLNTTLKSFIGNQYVEVKKFEENEKLLNKIGNCHLNVQAYIDRFRGSSVSGWLLNNNQTYIQRQMFIFSFHSVWQKPDGSWLDVTEDKDYITNENTIFVNDVQRLPDLVEGVSYNNFVIITEPKFAEYYGGALSKKIHTNKPYWIDISLKHLMNIDEHDGSYRLIGPNYPNNIEMMCKKYNLEMIDGKAQAKLKSGKLPVKFLFDFSVSMRA
jgi:hypothetical protein